MQKPENPVLQEPVKETVTDRVLSVAWKNHVPIWVAEQWVKQSAWYGGWKDDRSNKGR